MIIINGPNAHDFAVCTSSHENLHNVDLVVTFATAGAFPHSVGNPSLQAILAEDVTARFDNSVVEVGPADTTRSVVL